MSHSRWLKKWSFQFIHCKNNAFFCSEVTENRTLYTYQIKNFDGSSTRANGNKNWKWINYLSPIVLEIMWLTVSLKSTPSSKLANSKLLVMVEIPVAKYMHLVLRAPCFVFSNQNFISFKRLRASLRCNL